MPTTAKASALRYAELAMLSHQEESGDDRHPSELRLNAIAIMTAMKADLGMSHEELMLEAAKYLDVKVCRS
jgi:hypothetical protein